MEGIELADSLLYRDSETSKLNNNDLSNVFERLLDQVEIQNLFNNEINQNNWTKNKKLITSFNHGSNNCTFVQQNNDTENNERTCNLSLLDSTSFQKHFNGLDSKSKNSKINLNNMSAREREYNSTYFRPISANNFEELDENISKASMNGLVYDERIYENYAEERSITAPSNVQNDSINIKEGLYSAAHKPTILMNGLHFDKQESLLKNIDLSSKESMLETLNMPSTLKTNPTIINQSSQIPFHYTSTNLSEAPINKLSSEITPFNINSSLSQGIPSISTLFETAPLTNPLSTSTGTAITIPQGSYIFIPFSVPNFPVKDINHNDINIPLKQISPIILPKQSFSQNVTLPTADMVGSNEAASNFHVSYISNIEPLARSSKKKAEFAEFNYYFNIISDCHKMLVKDKNKIIMDKHLQKEENFKNITNYTARNNNNMNKVEKELTMLINSLFEINILISKIETLREISFFEPFYNILQKAAELIQSFQLKDLTPQYFTRIQSSNKYNEKIVEIQIEKLKRLLCDIQEIRSFLWASYTNLSLNRERSLSSSLKKLKSWSEMKQNLRQPYKLKESNVKTYMSSTNTSIGEMTISNKNLSPKSSGSTMKFDRNSIAVQTQSFAIPVSQYPTFPSRMTTILQRFPNQQPPSLSQYNYIQTSISNFTHPTLINHNNFPLASNCRLAYGSQPQIYSTTPLNTTQTNLSPRNFFIASSSIMTPILYQNRSHPIINNTPINFMLYKTNPQII